MALLRHLFLLHRSLFSCFMFFLILKRWPSERNHVRIDGIENVREIDHTTDDPTSTLRRRDMHASCFGHEATNAGVLGVPRGLRPDASSRQDSPSTLQ